MRRPFMHVDERNYEFVFFKVYVGTYLIQVEYSYNFEFELFGG